MEQTEEQLYEMKNKRKLVEMQHGEILEEHSVKPRGTCNGYELPTPLNLEHKSGVYSGDESPVLDQIKEPEMFRNGCTQRIVTPRKRSNPCKDSTDIEVASAVNSVLEGNDEQVKKDGVSIIRRSQRKRKLKFWDDIMAACGKKGSNQLKKPRKALSCLPCFDSSKGNGEDQEKDGTKIEGPDHANASKEILDTEALPENIELIDVLVKADELAANCELISSSRIECDVTKNRGKYIFSKKWKKKKKSMVYNRKWKKRRTPDLP